MQPYTILTLIVQSLTRRAPEARKYLLVLFLALGAYAAPGTSVSAQCTPMWQTAFEDDFAGNTLDTRNWTPYYSPGHAGHGLRRPSAFSVDNGLLTVTAKMIDGQIVSGGMSHKTPFTYGRFEARVRTGNPDPQQATSGVLIAWPVNQDYDNGGYTELDFYETGHNRPTRNPFYAFVHYNVQNHPDRPRLVYSADAAQWHDVRMDWTESELKFYLDGALVNTVTRPETIPHTAHRMTVQLDAFKHFMEGSVEMQVDWVRISSYHPGGDPDCNDPDDPDPENNCTLLDNGGFENGFYAWHVSPTTQLSTTANSGEQAVKVDGGWISSLTPGTGNTDYTVSGSYRSLDTTSWRGFGMDYLDESGTEISEKFQKLGDETGYSSFRLSGRSPIGTRFVRIWFYSQPGSSLLLDNVVLQKSQCR